MIGGRSLRAGAAPQDTYGIVLAADGLSLGRLTARQCPMRRSVTEHLPLTYVTDLCGQKTSLLWSFLVVASCVYCLWSFLVSQLSRESMDESSVDVYGRVLDGGLPRGGGLLGSGPPRSRLSPGTRPPPKSRRRSSPPLGRRNPITQSWT